MISIFVVEALSAFGQLEVKELGLREAQGNVLNNLFVHTNLDPGPVDRSARFGQCLAHLILELPKKAIV